MKIKITPQLEYTLSDEDIKNVILDKSPKQCLTIIYNEWLRTEVEKVLRKNNLHIPFEDIRFKYRKLYRHKRIDYGYGECRYEDVDLNIDLPENVTDISDAFIELMRVI